MSKMLSTNTSVLWFDAVDPTDSETDMDFCYFWYNNDSKDLFICRDQTFGSEIWGKFIFESDLSTVAFSGSYNDLTDQPSIPAAPSPSSASRSLNSAFQISASRNCLVSYSVDVSCAITLTTGQTGTAFLEYADDSGFTTNVVEVCRFVNSNSGTLTIGLNLVQAVTGTLSGFIPTAKYCRIRTANTVGTPTFTYRSGQEVLL